MAAVSNGLFLFSTGANNIIISGENKFIDKSIDVIEIDKTTKKNNQIDDELRFEQIINLYKTNYKYIIQKKHYF